MKESVASLLPKFTKKNESFVILREFLELLQAFKKRSAKDRSVKKLQDLGALTVLKEKFGCC